LVKKSSNNNHFSSFQRLRIPSPQYVAIHSTMLFANLGFGPFNLNADNIEREGMLEMVRLNITEEFLYYFPKWKSLHQQVLQNFNLFCEDIEEDYKSLESVKDQKEFAAKAKELSNSVILFDLRKGTFYSVKEFMKFTRNKSILKSLENYVLSQLGGTYD